MCVLQERSGSTVPSILNRMKTNEQPPTYHKVNKFTRGFQAIVDAYGMATYQEVNPSKQTILMLRLMQDITLIKLMWSSSHPPPPPPPPPPKYLFFL